MQMDLYIVTGASRGLGHALASQLAADAGARTAGVSRRGAADIPLWRDVRADLGTAEGQDIAIAAIRDAMRAEQWSRAVLINNAGILDPIGVVGALDVGMIRASAMINLAAPIALMSAFIAALAERETKGSVINISSGSGRRPIPGSGVYCATKAGLDMASRTAVLEVEAKQRPVVITSLAPGIFETDMQVVARSKTIEEFPSVESFRAFKSQNLLKTPAEVAAKIIALDKAGKLPAGIADLREL
jgi:benzil reductase ((S)-benzoin forming)